MRYLGVLIEQARQETDNLAYSATSGIPQSEFIQAANDAQSRLQNLIMVTSPEGVFEAEADIAATPGEESYDYPLDIYSKSRIKAMFFSRTGIERDFYSVHQGTQKERFFGQTGTPSIYVRKSDSFVLMPAPSSAGTIRLSYKKRLPSLELRRGVVSAVTLDATTRQITSLTLTTGDTLEASELLKQNHFTIVNRHGEIKMRAIAFTAINTGSGVVTIEAGFTYDSGETIAAGDYVIPGENATTHSELSKECERYLIAVMKWRAEHRDSSSDAIAEDKSLTSMEQEIVLAFADPDEDVDGIPILDQDFLYAGDGGNN